MIRFQAQFALLALVQSLFLALPAFAAREGSELVIQRQERAAADSKLIRIEGLLTCKMGEVNTGQPCALRLEDAKSGKSFNLNNADAAMRMFQSGSTSVAIEGTYLDAQTISVGKVNPLTAVGN
jgi:hypothetical protein